MRTANFRREQSGQTLVIVALMILVLLGFTGLVTDVAWYEVNLIRIQRAADLERLPIRRQEAHPEGEAVAARALVGSDDRQNSVTGRDE